MRKIPRHFPENRSAGRSATTIHLNMPKSLSTIPLFGHREEKEKIRVPSPDPNPNPNPSPDPEPSEKGQTLGRPKTQFPDREVAGSLAEERQKEKGEPEREREQEPKKMKMNNRGRIIPAMISGHIA